MILGIVLTSIIILILLIYRYETREHLNGFWTASSDFLMRAGLTQFTLFIDKSDGYIIITDQDNILLDQSISVSLSQNLLSIRNWIPYLQTRYFTMSTDADASVIPRKLLVEFYQYENKLIITDANEPDTIVAILFKNPELTSLYVNRDHRSDKTQKTNSGESSESSESSID